MRRPIICCLVWLAVWLMARRVASPSRCAVFEEPGPLKEKTISGYGRDKVLLMEVSGVILEGPTASWGCLKGVTSPSPDQGRAGKGRQR